MRSMIKQDLVVTPTTDIIITAFADGNIEISQGNHNIYLINVDCAKRFVEVINECIKKLEGEENE